MLPLGVLIEFTKFARKWTSTGLGKFDYGVALRILLDRNQKFEQLEELFDRINELEERMSYMNNPSNKQKVKKEGVKTFGDN